MLGLEKLSKAFEDYMQNFCDRRNEIYANAIL